MLNLPAARAEVGLDIPPAQAHVAKVLVACQAQLSTLHVTDWKQAQKEDPVLLAIVRHLKAPRHEFKKALKDVTDEKSAWAYLKARRQSCHERWPPLITNLS